MHKLPKKGWGGAGCSRAQPAHHLHTRVPCEIAPLPQSSQRAPAPHTPPRIAHLLAECDCSSLSLAPTPVCGKDGLTYVNRCIAVCQGVEVAHNEPCGAGTGLSGSLAALRERIPAATAVLVMASSPSA